MPQDIGPELRLSRPKSHIGFVSTTHAHPSSGRRRVRAHTSSASGVRKQSKQQAEEDEVDGEHHIELLEYEWPDLPPITDMKDAVTRRRVSQGIAYLLPVDKGKNSIDSKFRTDLRAMFQEPYATEGFGFDDNRVSKSAKIHFRTNVVDTKWTNEHRSNIRVSLNSESEKIRKLYAHSAPAGGRTRSGMDSEKLKTRSSLFLPIKAKAHPEATRLRKEVEDILKSVQEDNDEYDADKDIDTPAVHLEKESNRPSERHNSVSLEKRKSQNLQKRKSLLKFHAEHIDVINENEEENIAKAKGHTAQNFESYEQLKNTKPPKPTIPDMFKSEYLSKERNQEIWEWLHYGETITDFEYFLEICG